MPVLTVDIVDAGLSSEPEGHVVLQGIARLALAAPKRIIGVAVLVMIGTAIFGLPVTKSLSAGGMQDPASV